MVGVVIDRPVGENDVGLLGLEDLAEGLVMSGVDDRLAVGMPAYSGRAFKISQAFLASAIRETPSAPRRPFAPVQVEETTSCPRSV